MRYQVTLTRSRVATIPDDYLSLTIDSSLVVGGHWWGPTKGTSRGVAVDRVEPLDFDNPALRRYSSMLAPAMLRIGGTEADRIRYRIKKKRDQPAAGGPYEFVLKKKLWKALNRFAGRSGFSVLFTLNAGPSDRDESGAWVDTNARRLLAYTAKRGYPVVGWEFGNEVNGYPIVHGLKHRVGPERYARDFAAFTTMVRILHPGTKTVGPASAIWPIIGEANPIIPGFSRSHAILDADAVSWHYYPQQSTRSRYSTRRVGRTAMLQARNLDSILRWTRHVRRSLKNGLRTAKAAAADAGGEVGAKQPEIWVTETAHALFGGEPGLSDAYASTLWWLDELAVLAREGVHRVFRQSLVGGDYGLLREHGFEPNPDYFASFLWKKLMGPEVFRAPGVRGRDRKLRAYLHSAGDGFLTSQGPAYGGLYVLLLLNLHERQGVEARITGNLHARAVLEPEKGLESTRLLLNGVGVTNDLVFDWDKPSTRRRYGLRPLDPPEGRDLRLKLPPLGAGFFLVRPALRGDSERPLP